MGRSRDTLQHDGIGSQRDGAQGDGFSFADGNTLGIGLEAYVSNTDDVAAVSRGCHLKLAVHIGDGIGD